VPDNTQSAMNALDGPGVYQLVVDGELSDRFASLFEGMRFESDDGTTSITGPVLDQAQLFGLMNQTQELGLVLLSVQRMREPDTDADAGP